MKAEDRYDSLFRFYGEKEGVDWRLLKAQVRAESAFNPDAKSWVGAKGLAQFMDRTWEEWRDGTPGIQAPPQNLVLLNPNDPEDAIAAQAAFMRWLARLPFVAGDVEKALAAYNWGPGRVRLAVGKYGASWKNHLPEETTDYIGRIASFLAAYAKAIA